MGAAVSFIGNGGPAPPPTSARRGIPYMEGLEVTHEMFVNVRKQLVNADNTEQPASSPFLNYLVFAKVRASGTGMAHPLDPPVLFLVPQEATAEGLMPVSEKITLFTSRTLRSVVYYRGELALELMPQPHKGTSRKRFILQIADEHVSKKLWKATTRMMTMQFRAYWEHLAACNIPRAKPGFVAPTALTLMAEDRLPAGDDNDQEDDAATATPEQSPLITEALNVEPPTDATAPKPPSDTATGSLASPESISAAGVGTTQLLVGGKTNYPKNLRPTPSPPSVDGSRRPRGSMSTDKTRSSGYPGSGYRAFGGRHGGVDESHFPDYDVSRGARPAYMDARGAHSDTHQRWAQGPPETVDIGDPLPMRAKGWGAAPGGRGRSTRPMPPSGPMSRSPAARGGRYPEDASTGLEGSYEMMKVSDGSVHHPYMYQEFVKTSDMEAGHHSGYGPVMYSMQPAHSHSGRPYRDEGRNVILQQMPNGSLQQVDGAYGGPTGPIFVSPNGGAHFVAGGMQVVPVMVPMMYSQYAVPATSEERAIEATEGAVPWEYADGSKTAPV